MKKTGIINKLKQRRKKKGFTLVELVVVILIIAVLASATFLGGATVIKQARTTKATNDLRNYSSYLEDMFYNHPGYASKGITSGKVVESLNEYLTADLAVKAGADESKGTSVELKDAWDNAYNYAYYKNPTATEAAVLVWSNGPDQVSGSGLTSIDPTIGEDDIAVLVKMVNGEVSTLTSDSLAENAGGAGGGSGTTQVVNASTHEIQISFAELQTLSAEIVADNSITSTSTTAHGLTIGDKITVDGLTCYIAGFNHDVDNGETGITLVANSGKMHNMNSVDTNEGGWNDSNMRTYMNSDEFTDGIPTIKAAAKLVAKMSDMGGGALARLFTPSNEEKDYLWLLSYEEVFPIDYENYESNMSFVVSGQGSCYPIFTAENSSRTQISSSFWWLRSAQAITNNFFWGVGSSGGGSCDGVLDDNGIVFGFCI